MNFSLQLYFVLETELIYLQLIFMNHKTQEMKNKTSARRKPKASKQKSSNKSSKKQTNLDNSDQMEESEVFLGKKFVKESFFAK